MLKTGITELLGISYPIISAPMARHAGGGLAAAVSEAGGLGTFGAAGPIVEPGYVREQIQHIRSRTDQPFGVGFITHMLADAPENFELVLEEHVPVILFSFADPRPWLGRAKESGALTICQVQTVDAARIAADAGADVLTAQGNESGGHTGELNLLPFLIRLVMEFPDLPILAAGGIASGQSLAAVLAAGAEGASLGTAFLTAKENLEVPEASKQLILQSNAEDTVYTPVFDIIGGAMSGGPPWPDGIAARVYLNDLAREWQGRENELRDRLDQLIPIYAAARQSGDLNIVPSYFGESASFIHATGSASEVLTGICREAEKLLRHRADSLIR